MSCNFECLQTYLTEGGGGIKKMLPGAIYSPFVKVTFTNSGDTYTVGNNSSPNQANHACIKSFQYGASNGHGFVLEIFDEQGSSFDLFMQKLNKRVCGAEKDYNMVIDFGWIIDYCDGRKGVHKVSDYGGALTFMGINIEATYDGGKIKFTIQGKDMLSRVFDNRTDEPEGSDDQKIRLFPAMKRVFKNRCPSLKIRLLRRRGKTLVPWKFLNSDGGPDGPMGVWPADQQNVLSVVRKWLNSFTTDRKLGVTPIANPAAGEPEIIFMEDFRLAPRESAAGRSLGTYIVGGDCSPVISFQPTAKWILKNEGGNFGGVGGFTQRPIKPRRELKRRGGDQTFIAPPQNDILFRPPDDVADKFQRAVAAQEAANKWIELTEPIEAELKIQGNPFFAHVDQFTGSFISIVVINPHHIFGIENQTCGEWLALPPCNRFYSDQNWIINAVDHSMREGSYVTTLKVRMLNVKKLEGFFPELAPAGET